MQIIFLPSFTDQQRAALLAACIALIYTPSHEHFGIVPLEAMAAGRPVIACNNGGPLESVLHNRTGFLCEPRPQSFAAAMQLLLVPLAYLQCMHFLPYMCRSGSLPFCMSKLAWIVRMMPFSNADVPASHLSKKCQLCRMMQRCCIFWVGTLESMWCKVSPAQLLAKDFGLLFQTC